MTDEYDPKYPLGKPKRIEETVKSTPEDTWLPHPTNKDVLINQKTGAFRTKNMNESTYTTVQQPVQNPSQSNEDLEDVYDGFFIGDED